MHVPDPESLTANTYLAAVGGAIIGLRAFPGSTKAEKWANFACGCILAVFAGPAIAEYLNISSPRITAFVVFSIGAAGLVILGALIDGVRQTKFSEIITGWLSKKGGTP